MAELQTIVDRDGTSFVGKAELMQDRIHEVAGAIAGEDAAGSIGAMGSRSKPKDENAGAWVTESRHRPGPVGLVQEGTAANLPDPFTVGSQPRATLAGDDVVTNEVKRSAWDW